MRNESWKLLPLLLLLLAPAAAAGQPLGGEGESCRARSDCAEGLRCVANVCTPAAGPESAPEDGPGEDVAAGTEPTARPGTEAGTDDAAETGTETAAEEHGSAEDGGWTDFVLGGAHGFVGIALGPALTGDWYYGGEPTWRPGLLFALRGGLLMNRIELALEFAPVTLLWNAEAAPVLSFNVSIGGLVEIAPHLYWPLRFGLGVTGVNVPHDTTYMQGRLDLIGLVYQYGHLLFEFDLFSPRFSSEFRHFGLWTVPFMLAASYVF